MRMSRRALLAGAAATACRRQPQQANNSSCRTAQRPPLLIGYGVVNLWHTIDAAKLASRLAEAGCTLTEIEYVAWFNKEAREGKSTETHPEAARRFVDEMRRRRITTLISLVNWNSEAARKQDDDWFRARLLEVRRGVGPEGVILMGVSEPDGQEDGKAYRWMQIAAREWNGRRAANGDGGRGEPHVEGFDFADWHHCEDFDAKTVRVTVGGKPVINNTDCGPVLNPGPARVRAMARVAIKRNAHFCVYGFRDERIDEAVIDSLGEELRGRLSGSDTCCAAQGTGRVGRPPPRDSPARLS
jgi:hypothetical protein